MPKAFNRVLIVAGEESGDAHAALLIKELKAKQPLMQITAIGGRQMQAAGATLLFDLAQYGVTGLTEVFRHLSIIRKAFLAIKAHLQQDPPDLLILVDYPGFNLRLAKYAKKNLNLKIIYYISPQIWAWKAKRIHHIKQYVDKMAVILPFEKALYEKAQVPVCFVGHPLVEKMAKIKDPLISKQALQLPPDRTIIALLPGSRINEIERHMPILCDSALLLHKTMPAVHFVIPVVETIPIEKIRWYFKDLDISLSFISGKALDCMNAADYVIVASGTASLEAALLAKPMCILYKASFITYALALKLIKVRFLGLCNLLVNKMLVPEFIQQDCNAQELALYIKSLHTNPKQKQKMIDQLQALKISLSSDKSDCSISELVVSELPEITS